MTVRTGDRVLLDGEERQYFVRAGEGTFSTDHGIIDLSGLVGLEPGAVIQTHLDREYRVRIPRAPDFFSRARRTGAPMLPKDIGMVIAATGMMRDDVVVDAGTGSGIAAIYFGGIAGEVRTYESRPEFARIAEATIRDARLENVTVTAADVLTATGPCDIVHLDLEVTPAHIRHAHEILVPGGYLACYSPFLEQMFSVLDTGEELFSELEVHECLERILVRSRRGTRPSTRVCHTGYIAVGRK